MCSSMYVPYLKSYCYTQNITVSKLSYKVCNVFKYLYALLRELLLHSEHNYLEVKLLGM